MGKPTAQEKQDLRDHKARCDGSDKQRIWPRREQVKEVGRALRGR